MRQSKIFFPLAYHAIVANQRDSLCCQSCCPTMHLSCSYPECPRFSIVSSVSEEYSIIRYERLPGPVTEATSDRHQRPSMWPRLWQHYSIRHFGSTATQKFAGGKISGFERKSFTRQNSPDSKVSGFKVPTLKFEIQNLRRHDQTGESLFRTRPLVSKRQNQSGTKCT